METSFFPSGTCSSSFSPSSSAVICSAFLTICSSVDLQFIFANSSACSSFNSSCNNYTTTWSAFYYGTHNSSNNSSTYFTGVCSLIKNSTNCSSITVISSDICYKLFFDRFLLLLILLILLLIFQLIVHLILLIIIVQQLFAPNSLIIH